MKRHNFSGQRATHGVKNVIVTLEAPVARQPGYPKGKRMPGQYGNAQCTIRNQKVEG